MNRKSVILSILLGSGVLALLYVISLKNYLLFHSLAEIFSVVIAFSIFIIAWNSRNLMENSYLLVLGIAYLFVGALDVLHTLAYTGMGVFPGTGTNLATELWIGARYMESLSLLLATLFLGRKAKMGLIFAGYAAAAGLLLLSIFYWDNFPHCFNEGQGLTVFKKTSEYLISGVLLAAIVALIRSRRYFHHEVLRLIVASIGLTIASELAFTFYVSAYGFSNLVGHFFKIVSYYLIYKALIETGLRHPLEVLFREIKQRERRFRALAENAPDIIARLDCDNRFLYANPAMRTLTARPLADLTGRTPEEVGLPASFSRLLTGALQKVCQEREVETHEIDLAASDGRRFYRVTVVPEEQAEEGVRTVLAVASDITELKEAEAITRRDKEMLEQLVTQRSGELLEAHRKLEDAKRLSGMGMLAATVAHELRNPLGVIQAAILNIRRKSQETAIVGHLANIEKKVSESNLIISNLLRYSRIRPPKLQSVSLYDLLREAMEAAADRFQDRDITVASDLESIRRENLNIDVVQIREVFDNILNNAYQAITCESGIIEVSTRLERGRHVAVLVKDDGVGIAREDLGRVFEPFFTKRIRGTGLGLTICREIVKLHGGTVGIESRQGSGTVVTVTLPASEPGQPT
jgi:PAS domain S-box-containing protein